MTHTPPGGLVAACKDVMPRSAATTERANRDASDLGTDSKPRRTQRTQRAQSEERAQKDKLSDRIVLRTGAWSPKLFSSSLSPSVLSVSSVSSVVCLFSCSPRANRQAAETSRPPTGS